ncbi:hypothetical protein AAFF_G00083480 [Aldrovandia affinis]|uniref:Uncharacterized protein n=1 Tax=Aldrovandia affinis TaxID=143900 RepID=A0AAD7WCU7_9TELE|nr:hypothetical protein AAFF_G00083480 [Aldrovandia affinis]
MTAPRGQRVRTLRRRQRGAHLSARRAKACAALLPTRAAARGEGDRDRARDRPENTERSQNVAETFLLRRRGIAGRQRHGRAISYGNQGPPCANAFPAAQSFVSLFALPEEPTPSLTFTSLFNHQ